MKDILSEITHPVAKGRKQFAEIFSTALSSTDGLLNQMLQHIMQRGGKRMRPLLTLLVAKSEYLKQHGALYRDFMQVKSMLTGDDKPLMFKALHAACSHELLHTASLVHDDVVDEADERRGQASVNASFNNRLAVLVGDYILSTALMEIAKCNEPRMTEALARLGQTLSRGEVAQQQNISTKDFSIDNYYDVISKKTASLFEACCYLGAYAAGATEEDIVKACHFGHNIGIIFQIRDDIFDYSDSKKIGKPTGIDMREGKLTLPVLFVLNDKENACPQEMTDIAYKIKSGDAKEDEIERLIAYTIEHGGINFARHAMDEYYAKAIAYVNDDVRDEKVKNALKTYLDYVIGRDV